MKKVFVLFYLLTIVFFLAGQPVKDSCLIQKKLEAERLPEMNMPRAGHSVFYVGGELTVVGGHTSGFLMTPTAEYFRDGQWYMIPTVYHHDNGMAVVLDGGRSVLIAGGHEKNLGIGQSYEVEMYDRESHTFDGFGCLYHKRAFAQGVELDSGRVLITGNHQGNDAFELFDGQKYFHHVKDVAVWRSSPYLLPVAADDAISFGAVWRDRFEPCATVDRLKGEPFCVPLLKEWMPILYDQNNHAQEAFIGDKANGDYSYLVAAQNLDGETAFVRIHDTAFSLLPTTCPIPMMTEWGRITYYSSAIADRNTHRAYLLGNDTTGRIYVVSVEYDKRPAPLTLYYTDPLPDFGNTTPVLTPDGDLVITGGIVDDNFAPFASVWLLHTGTPKTVATTETQSNWIWLWVLCGLLGVVAVVYLRRFASLRAQRSNPGDKASGLDCFVVPPRNDEDNEEPTAQPDSTTNELMARITQLMETQHLYLNPELKVGDVADALGVHRNTVSACLNVQDYSFNQLVNNYRLQHAKNLLRETPDMKISTVGSASGFASDSSFFRIFKTATGMSPKEWATQQSVS